MLDEPRLARIVGSRMAVRPLPIKGGKVWLYNNNPLLRLGYPGDDRRQDRLHRRSPATASWPPRGGDGRRLGVVLLHSPDTGRQAKRLLDAGFRCVLLRGVKRTTAVCRWNGHGTVGPPAPRLAAGAVALPAAPARGRGLLRRRRHDDQRPDRRAARDAVLCIVNAERTARGLGALTADDHAAGLGPAPLATTWSCASFFDHANPAARPGRPHHRRRLRLGQPTARTSPRATGRRAR